MKNRVKDCVRDLVLQNIPGRLLVLITLCLLLLINSEAVAQNDVPDQAEFWLWTFLGRLHPMIVHFPISLIIVAMVMEIIQWKKGTHDLEKGIHILLILGAVSALVAVVFGLLLSNSETYGSDLLPVHQWAGISTMLLSMMTVLASIRKARQARRALLIITVFGVTVAGHYGSSITHGEDYLSEALPFNQSSKSDGNTAMFTAADGPLNEAQVQELSLQVRTIFAHQCYKCHGQVKQKGELRLDTKKFVMKGGEDGPILVPGDPGESEIIRRVKLPRDHKDAMPEKGDGLTKNEIALLEFWIKQGAPWPDGPEKSLYRVAALQPRMPDIPTGTSEHPLPIDRFVNAYFDKHDIKWTQPVDDHTYLRRVYLDVLGLIPPPDSVDAFVRDPRPDKRALLVSRILARNDDYAQHWLTFWNDALRNDYSGTGYITKGRWDITSWLYTSLQENKPYDIFVKELISPTEKSKGFIDGIKWRGTINASQRTEMQAAQNVSQVFLGLNIKCASCHDSFVSDWKLDEAYAFANIFADTTLEINRCDKPTGKFAGRKILFKELGEINPEAVTSERLKQLADFLVQPKDGRLYRTVVNRVWAQVMGRGIVEPVDVMDNEPWSQDLLDWLASDFTASGYDLKKLLYKILTSETYQLPSIALKEASMITAPDYVFTGMVRRRLTAEQFADAVSVSIHPMYPDSMIVTTLLPKSIKVAFARAALVKNDPFLTALGRPNRETVSTSRSSQANLLQALELTNGTHFNEAIKRGADGWKKKYPDAATMVSQIYRNTLGRLPEESEMRIAQQALGANPSEGAVQDFIWAMTLHPEFQLIY